jgi:hypothetical protein
MNICVLAGAEFTPAGEATIRVFRSFITTP